MTLGAAEAELLTIVADEGSAVAWVAGRGAEVALFNSHSSRMVSENEVALPPVENDFPHFASFSTIQYLSQTHCITTTESTTDKSISEIFHYIFIIVNGYSMEISRSPGGMSGYLNVVEQFLQMGDYKQLASLLLVPSGKKPSHPLLNELMSNTSIPLARVRQLRGPYDVIVGHFMEIFSPSSSSEDGRHKLAMNMLQAFLKHFSGKDTGDGDEVPVMKALCENVVTLAWPSSLERPERLEQVARLLPRCFTACLTGRETGKRWAALRIVVLLFRVYFQLNTLRLCGNIVRALEQAQDLPPITSFPKSETIAYWYYRARLCIHQKDFKMAETMLTDAFALCHRDDLKHRREILTFLVPLKLIHGALPTHQLLQQYGLDGEFGRLRDAVRTGNLLLFDAVLAENQAFYMQKELFLLIQIHLKSLILRTLFRRIYLVTVGLPGAADSRLPLANLEAGFAVFGMGGHVSRDEIECWTANLVNDGYIRGYLSHDKGVLVLSKKNPFPAPSTLF